MTHTSDSSLLALSFRLFLQPKKGNRKVRGKLSQLASVGRLVFAVTVGRDGERFDRTVLKRVLHVKHFKCGLSYR